MKFKILWPDPREVDEEQIISWARDAIANEEISADTDLTDAFECVKALSDAGLITLGKK